MKIGFCPCRYRFFYVLDFVATIHIVSEQVRAHIALIFVALIYGGNYSIAKIVMDDEYVKPLGFIVLRVERRDLGLLFLCAMFGVAFNQMLAFAGLDLTTPINASLLMTMIPVTVLIASALLLGEPITSRKILGILIGMAGAILLIAYGEEVAFERQQALGNAMILACAVSFSIYLVLVKRLMRKYKPVTVVKWIFTFGIFLVIPFGFRQLQVVNWSSFTPAIWLSIAYVLLGTTFLSYLLNAYALKIVNPSTVSIYVYLQPLFTTLIALLLAKDELTWIKVVAGFLIFIGVYLVSIKGRPRLKVS